MSTPTTHPDVSIVFVNYNCASLILRCLDSLVAVTTIPYEVLVADNGSAPEDIALLQARVGIRILPTGGNIGFGRACNHAQAQASGRWTLLLNPDTLATEPFVEPLIAHLEANPDTGLVAPRLLQDDGSFQCSWNVAETLLWEFVKTHYLQRIWFRLLERRFGKRYGREHAWPVGTVVGACWAMPSALYRELGGFDPDFFMNGEDSEFCDRIRASGHQIHLLPWVKLHHAEGSIQRSDWSRYMQHRFDAFRIYIEKRYRGLPLFVARALWWEAIAARILLGFLLLRGPHRSRLGGYIASVRRFRHGWPA